MKGRSLLEVRGITKDYPGTRALEEVSLVVREGEVHALVGENGAGKSTLVKVLSGAVQPDSGRVLFREQQIRIDSPRDAFNVGISTVYQEYGLLPFMSIAANLFLGREETHFGFVKCQCLDARTRDACAAVGLNADPRQLVESLSTAEKQLLGIAKGIAHGTRLLLLDEPTASLAPAEVRRLFEVITRLRTKGVSTVYISHRLEEIFEIADRVTVLKDGTHVKTAPVSHFRTTGDLVRLMIGRELEEEFYGGVSLRATVPTATALSVKNLSGGKVRNISFEVFPGEIVGFAGLVGSGRTEIMRLVAGVDRKEKGDILIYGQAAEIRNCRDSIDVGVGFVPEDRASQGLILGWSILKNLSLAALGRCTHWGFINSDQERDIVDNYVGRLAIKCPSVFVDARSLSGGNQQKIVLGKWLATQCKILILDEPTRGIDVGAKKEIYRLLNELAKQNIALIVVSSELPELLSLCDRIVVVSDGRITADLPRASADEETILLYATAKD